MALLGARLAERGSDYHVVFDALAALVGEPAEIADIRRQAADRGARSDNGEHGQDLGRGGGHFSGQSGRLFRQPPMGPREAQPVQWMPRPGSTQQPRPFSLNDPALSPRGRGVGERAIFHHSRLTIMNYLDTLFFGVYPYLAGAVFLLGSLARFDRDQFTWKAHSSQILNKKDMRLASNLFHVGIILLFFGHFFGMLTPPEILHALGVSASAKQVLAVVAGSIFGLMCFVGLTMLVKRRLTDPRVRATSTRMDIFILLLLYVQLILGLLTVPVSLMHLDGHNMLQFDDVGAEYRHL